MSARWMLPFWCGLSLLLAVPLAAQDAGPPPTSKAPAGLPAWAEPARQPDYALESSNGGAPAPPPAPQQVPIDGGLGLLAAAGVGYAVHRLRRRHI